MARLKGMPGFGGPFGLTAGRDPAPQNPYPGPAPATYAPNQPLVLVGSVSLAPNSTGSPNTLSLKNQTGLPIEIDEIHFRIHLSVPMAVMAAGGIYVFAQHLVEANFTLGNLPLTNGFLPVALLCREAAPVATFQFDMSQPLAGNDDQVACTRWKLPRPLWLAPGETLLPVFRHPGLVAQNVDLTVTYVCRTVSGSRSPDRIAVPYATAFMSDTFPLDGTFAEQTSDERDLANPFDVPLNVEHFVVSSLFYAQLFGAPGPMYGDFRGASQIQSLMAIGVLPVPQTDEFLVRIVDSRGVPMIREYSRIFCIADQVYGTIDLPHVLDSHGYYRLSLQTAGAVIAARFWKQLRFSMIGWRQEDVK